MTVEETEELSSEDDKSGSEKEETNEKTQFKELKPRKDVASSPSSGEEDEDEYLPETDPSKTKAKPKRGGKAAKKQTDKKVRKPRASKKKRTLDDEDDEEGEESEREETSPSPKPQTKPKPKKKSRDNKKAPKKDSKKRKGGRKGTEHSLLL